MTTPGKPQTGQHPTDYVPVVPPKPNKPPLPAPGAPGIPTEPPVDPAYAGPYDVGNGSCAYGHPVNGYGRCAPLNATPPTCPPNVATPIGGTLT